MSAITSTTSSTDLTVTEINDAQLVATVAAYVAAKPSGRVALIAGLNTRLVASFAIATSLAGDDESRAAGVVTVQHIMATIAACNESTAKVVPEKVIVSPLMVIAQRAADLRLAADLLEQGIVSPAELDGAPAIDIEALGLALPYAAGNYASAAAIGSTKITRSTFSNAIADVIAAAFADLPSGAYLTSTQIGVQGGHTRGGLASGAINASLYGANCPAGVVAAEYPANKRGAFKA